jgi:hypothetical protein
MRIVTQMVEQGHPIDAAITSALYPRGAPRRWADWSDEAKDIHLEAVEQYMRVRKALLVEPAKEEPTRLKRRHKITRERGWEVVRESMAAINEKGRLTWADLATRLGVTPRAAQHLLKDRLGFRFTPPNTRARAIVYAPCAACGIIHPAAEYRTRDTGPCCGAKQAT